MERATSRTWVLAGAVAVVLSLAAACGGDESTETPAPTAPAGVTRHPGTNGTPGTAGLDDPIFPLHGNGGYDVTRYTLDLTPDLESDTLSALVGIDGTATQALSAFNLDYAGPEISAVEVDGRAVEFRRDGRALSIVPLRPIANGNLFTTEVTLDGRLEPLIIEGFPIPMGWTRAESGSALVHGFTQAWYPVNQTAADKATYSVRVTVPKPLVVSASGTLRGTTDNGDSLTYAWELDAPAAGVAFAIGDYVLETLAGTNGVPISIYYPPRFSESARSLTGVAPEVMEFYSQRFGPYPFESFGVTLVVGRLPFGGFSSSGHVFFVLDEGVLDEGPPGPSSGPPLGQAPRRPPGPPPPPPQPTVLIAHEIAHQWFGNSVTPATSADSWLSEGFATYASYLWVEHQARECRAHDSAIEQCAYGRRAHQTAGLGRRPR